MKKKKNYLEIIRVIAVILVIFNHTDLNWAYYHDTKNMLTYMTSLMTTLIVKIDVPLFFMVSGALLLPKDESVIYIWKNRILRMVEVWFVFSLAQYLFRVARGKIESGSVLDFGVRLIHGDIQDTYWFLYIYIAFLIILPFMRRLSRGLKIEEYILLLCIVFGLEVYTVFSGIFDWYIQPSFKGTLQLVSSYLFYWISGCFIEQNYEILDKNKKIINRVCGVIILTEIIYPFLYSICSFITLREYADIVVLNTSVITPVVCFWIVKSNIDEDSKLVNKLANIGQYCFAIYLLEQYMRVVFFKTYVYSIEILPGVIGAFIYALLTFIGSLLVAYILKHIPVINRFI